MVDRPDGGEEALESPQDAPGGGESGGRARPQDVRVQLAEDLTEDYDLVRETLRGAVKATKPQWVSCPGCKKRVEVPVADWSARTRAVELWIEQGLGKQATSAQKAANECERCSHVDQFFAETSEEELDAHFIAEAILHLEYVAGQQYREAEKQVRPELPTTTNLVDQFAVRAAMQERRPELCNRSMRRVILDALQLEPKREQRVLTWVENRGARPARQ